MSLETALQETTAAINALIVILKAQTSAAPAAQPATKIEATSAEPAKAERVKAEEPQAKAKAEEPVKEEPPAQGDSPDYATTAAAVNALVKARGRQVAVDVLASFKATSLKDVKPEQFTQVIAACQQAAQAEAVQ